jgi:type II secretory pathway pseudopilin PulG
MHPLPLRPAQGGFSIIEMMIGVSLVTIAFVGLAPLMISTNHVTETVSENEIARSAARAKLDELRRVPYASLATGYVNHSFGIDLDGDGHSDLRERVAAGGVTRTGSGGTGGTTANAIPVGSVVVDEVPGGELVGEALRIQVVLRWSSRQGPQEYRLHTIRAKD